MKTELEKIYKDKKKTIKTLINSNNKMLAVVYGGLAKNKSIRDIHREIKDIYKSSPIKDNKTLNYCLKLTKKGKKNIENNKDKVFRFDENGKKYEVDISILALMFIDKEDSYHTTMSFAYKYSQDIENKSKENLLKRELKQNHVFYLASSHFDVAQDHKDYQGKIYYNQNWKTFIKSDDLRKEIDKYISKRNLKSFQWVTGRPVWFITRPNCRHYFKKISIEETLKESVKSLLDKYNMTKQIGDRRTQTIKHPTRKDWYNQANIENIIDKYENRLKFHQLLYNQSKNIDLENYIVKDKYLIKKWKSYLQSKI